MVVRRKSEVNTQQRVKGERSMANKQPSLDILFTELDGFIHEEEYQKVIKTCDKSMYHAFTSTHMLHALSVVTLYLLMFTCYVFHSY